ncbi:hypothetical protein Snoj_45830 [Streptomyces nojiriensis]|uniref:Uncharacterized protein n=1 Tax=Streptomyces nojiriensis TaxID=66374 RepID=A0ABQ3SSB1_9ACTN|nr:hypothetical protein GCM10010205_68530 [Streptomyces nojiriensis]GHI70665.1 hypothetical protein Snoj_45830 [Streptomyces nojiriensis]
MCRDRGGLRRRSDGCARHRGEPGTVRDGVAQPTGSLRHRPRGRAAERVLPWARGLERTVLPTAHRPGVTLAALTVRLTPEQHRIIGEAVGGAAGARSGPLPTGAVAGPGASPAR